jgi:hypothetical protein
MVSLEDLVVRNLTIRIANLEAENAKLAAMLELQSTQTEEGVDEDGDESEDPVLS